MFGEGTVVKLDSKYICSQERPDVLYAAEYSAEPERETAREPYPFHTYATAARTAARIRLSAAHS